MEQSTIKQLLKLQADIESIDNTIITEEEK